MFTAESSRARVVLVVLVAVSLLAVTVLASGLSSVEIRNSQILTFDAIQQMTDLAGSSLQVSVLSAFTFLANLIRIALLIFLPVSIYFFIKSPNARKRVLIQLLYLVGFTYLVISLSKALGQPLSEVEITPPALEPRSSPGPQVTTPIADVPSWAYIVASIAVTALFATFGLLIIRWYRNRHDVARAASGEARWALDVLDKGAELENVVFQAYHRLCAVAARRLGRRRRKDMTPLEYEELLARSGVPDSPLARLTRLFEKARYSSAPLTAVDEREAVSALEAILQEGI